MTAPGGVSNYSELNHSVGCWFVSASLGWDPLPVVSNYSELNHSVGISEQDFQSRLEGIKVSNYSELNHSVGLIRRCKYRRQDRVSNYSELNHSVGVLLFLAAVGGCIAGLFPTIPN